MGNIFRKPNFRTGDLECRYENGVVCIYGTAEGLRRVAAFCQELIESPSISHIHLEDYPILTAESEKGAIAIDSPDRGILPEFLSQTCTGRALS
jgi:hypothetical protein